MSFSCNNALFTCECSIQYIHLSLDTQKANRFVFISEFYFNAAVIKQPTDNFGENAKKVKIAQKAYTGLKNVTPNIKNISIY